jgi:transcriptional regulator with GAF, ATPase, and Fis domain
VRRGQDQSNETDRAAHCRPTVVRSLPIDLDAVERQRIEDTLIETDRNVAKTAKRLGLTRTQLYVRLRKYQLERPAA